MENFQKVDDCVDLIYFSSVFLSAGTLLPKHWLVVTQFSSLIIHNTDLSSSRSLDSSRLSHRTGSVQVFHDILWGRSPARCNVMFKDLLHLLPLYTRRLCFQSLSLWLCIDLPYCACVIWVFPFLVCRELHNLWKYLQISYVRIWFSLAASEMFRAKALVWC